MQETKIKEIDQRRYLTKEEIVESLKQIFRKHIGSEKPITKLKLFKSIYGDASRYDAYELWYNWTKIRQCMNWMRKTTKYFIVCRQNERHNSIWEYFIVTNQADADAYKGILKGTKRKIDFMLKRCDEAINKKFHVDIEKGLE